MFKYLHSRATGSVASKYKRVKVLSSSLILVDHSGSEQTQQKELLSYGNYRLSYLHCCS